MMLELKNIGKVYRGSSVETVALKGVSLSVEEGEYVAIMGTSASGKSTLLNILGGIDRPTEGSYFFGDSDISACSMKKLHEFRRDHIGFVFQNFALMNRYTVYENVELPLLPRRTGRAERKKRVTELLGAVGLSGLEKKKPLELSGGQQQRCAIARALVSDPELLLADEPTGALDQKTGAEIMELFDRIHREGKTVILVTHDPGVAEHAERLIRIEDGCIKSDKRKQK